MKRDIAFALWLRCRTCGSIFPDRTELREHLASHTRTEQPSHPANSSPDDVKPETLVRKHRPDTRS
jgi:hypothetical protein